MDSWEGSAAGHFRWFFVHATRGEPVLWWDKSRMDTGLERFHDRQT